LVELLVDRRGPDDISRARELVVQLENLTAAFSVPTLQLWPLLSRARLARALGDVRTYVEVVTRYHDLAEELDARGHRAIAK
jgi:hypothetical protein